MNSTMYEVTSQLNEKKQKNSTMIENELRNLEKIKARQKREVKLMVESELKA
jgi:hypothetical protein